MFTVIEDWCKGCNICITRCPVKALEESTKINKRGVYPPKLKDENECNFCRLCELLCPDFAITITPDPEEKTKEQKSKLIIGGITNEV